jgi:hypothetical protein
MLPFGDLGSLCPSWVKLGILRSGGRRLLLPEQLTRLIIPGQGGKVPQAAITTRLAVRKDQQIQRRAALIL